MSKKNNHIAFKFVEFIPSEILEGVVYISVQYATAAHKCCCGCGNEVITPFSPTDWKLVYNGKTVSLNPSIGNWGFKCKSHYWIERNKIVWAEKWSDQRIKNNRAFDRIRKTKETNYQNVSAQNTKNDDQNIWIKIRDIIGF